MSKVMCLITAVVLTSCDVSASSYNDDEKLDQAEMDAACVALLSSLYPKEEVVRGDWVQKWEWRKRLYQVDGRIFMCKQTHRLPAENVVVNPVSFGEASDD